MCDIRVTVEIQRDGDRVEIVVSSKAFHANTEEEINRLTTIAASRARRSWR